VSRKKLLFPLVPGIFEKNVGWHKLVFCMHHTQLPFFSITKLYSLDSLWIPVNLSQRWS